jgi:hypothetical protein
MEDEPPTYTMETGLKIQCMVDRVEKPITHLHEGIEHGLVG